MAGDPIAQLRKICMLFPEATEQVFGGHTKPTFRIRNKIFAMVGGEHDEVVAVWCKAPPGAQHVLIGADPARYFSPPYVGPKGWIGIRLNRGVDWDAVASHIEESYRMTAPKRLVNAM